MEKEKDKQNIEEEKSEEKFDDSESIPLADDDPSAIIDDESSSQFSEADRRATKWKKGYESFDSIPSMISDVPPVIGSGPSSLLLGETASHISEQMSRMCMDSNDENYSPNEVEEKARLIAQVLELQNTLDDLTNRVDAVKEENLKLRSENSVLGQYIENLMQASAVFQAVSPRSRRKHRPPVGNQLGTVIRCTAKAVRSASSATTPANAKSSPSSLGTPSPSIASSSSGASGTSSNERLKVSGYGNAY